MNKVNLFFSPEENRYYWTGSDNCFKCKKIISLQGILVWDFWKTELRQQIFCANCKHEALRSAGQYAEIKPVVIGFENILSEDIEGVLPQLPSLANASGLSVVDAATKISQGKVVDNTVYSKPILLVEKKKMQIENKEVKE